MTAPLFYVDALPESRRVQLTGEDARHAAGSLRLRVGEPVLVGDGHGRTGQALVVAVQPKAVEVEIAAVTRTPAPRAIRVVQALPKGDRADLVVELLTETGVSEIVPWQSTRSVPDWRGKEHAKVQRWQRVARAAAMQSRRTWLPQVLPLNTLDHAGQVLVLHEETTDTLYDVDLASGPITVVVGPEGGLTDDEVAGLQDQGARIVGLGPTIMRTSTAGAAACVWIRGFEMRSRA